MLFDFRHIRLEIFNYIYISRQDFSYADIDRREIVFTFAAIRDEI